MIKMNWWFAAAILGLTCIPGIAATWNADNTLPAKIGLTLLMPGGTLIIGGAIYGIIRLAGRRRRNRLLAAAPQVFIGSDAVYCGGEFGFWGSGMLRFKERDAFAGTAENAGVQHRPDSRRRSRLCRGRHHWLCRAPSPSLLLV